MNRNKPRERILLYLYDEMSSEEKTQFLAEVESNAELKELLAEEEALHGIYSSAAGKEVSEVLLKESRLRLREALRLESRTVESTAFPFGRLFNLTPMRAAAGAFAMLMIGIFLGREVLGPTQIILEGSDREIASSGKIEGGIIPARMLEPYGFEVVDLQVLDSEPATGDVILSFDAVSNIAVKGNLSDERIRKVLASALKSDLESTSNLETVELLSNITFDSEIRDALVHALENDPNPGVRLESAKALKNHVDDPVVKRALLSTLARDANPGIRIVAIEALRPLLDPETIPVIKTRAESDTNEYIRMISKETIAEWIEKTNKSIN